MSANAFVVFMSIAELPPLKARHLLSGFFYCVKDKDVFTIKTNKKVTVVSDAHLGNGIKNVHNVMRIIKNAEFVVFNGDIFELYIHDFTKRIYHKEFWPIIKWMMDNTNKFVYIVGNHDSKLWDIASEIDWKIYESVRIVQAGKEIVCVHGHMFDRLHRKHHKLSKFYHWLEYLANRIFQTNWQDLIFRKKRFFYRFATGKKDKHLPHLRKKAREYAEALDIDIMIHGHSHFRNIDYYKDKTIIDQGGFQVGRSYVVIENGEARLVINK